MPTLLCEIEILIEVKNIKGCIQLQDFFYDKDKISLIFPFYSNGDLYKYMRKKVKGPLSEI